MVTLSPPPDCFTEGKYSYEKKKQIVVKNSNNNLNEINVKVCKDKYSLKTRHKNTYKL